MDSTTLRIFSGSLTYLGVMRKKSRRYYRSGQKRSVLRFEGIGLCRTFKNLDESRSSLSLCRCFYTPSVERKIRTDPFPGARTKEEEIKDEQVPSGSSTVELPEGFSLPLPSRVRGNRLSLLTVLRKTLD